MGHPEAVLAGMVLAEVGVGLGSGVVCTGVGLGRDGAELVAADGGGLLSAADDCGTTGATELGDGSGLGDGEGDGDADGVGDGVGLADGLELAARVASAGFAISGLP